ncbi:hypothetical protein BDN72DRAFT_739457, partial [Pluteus cervinus]
GHWPRVWKESETVVIPKPGRPDYTKTKAYRPIALLSTTSKLCEKVLASRLQYLSQVRGSRLTHPAQ